MRASHLWLVVERTDLVRVHSSNIGVRLPARPENPHRHGIASTRRQPTAAT